MKSLQDIYDQIQDICDEIAQLPKDEAIEALNTIREALHTVSPMREHPVDCVLWKKRETIQANSYNPNAVAPPEMKLLKRSIMEDGYTQPIVCWQEAEDTVEIIDGYHRSLVGESLDMEYLPLTITNPDRTGESDRMASTIRHNRARGTHSIDLMQKIVAELVESGMSDKWIMQHMGMDVDELLRLKQLTGLAALFGDAEFSNACITEEE